MGKKNSGLVEVDPPSRATTHPPVWSDAQLTAITEQLKNGRWLTDHEPLETRSKAYHKAKSLRDKLSGSVQVKTWIVEGGFLWAIKRKD